MKIITDYTVVEQDGKYAVACVRTHEHHIAPQPTARKAIEEFDNMFKRATGSPLCHKVYSTLVTIAWAKGWLDQ